MKRDYWFIVIAIAIIVTAITVIWWNNANKEVVNIETAGSARKGPKDAKVELVVFADFECPACAQTAPMLEVIQEDFKDDVALIYKHFPLNSIHPNANKAAQVTEAARKQGKFWEMHNALYIQQAEWASLTGVPLEKRIEEYAKVIGIEDIEAFKKAMNSDEVQAIIDRDLEQVDELGIGATPTMFLNNEEVKDRSIEGMKQKIKELLEEAE